jgi:diguanylate cyclase (GGDEF)-like protein/PAS domain S-box-containing protein
MAFRRWEGAQPPVHVEEASARLALAPDFDAPAAARRAVLGLSNGYDEDFLADAALLVTEVVTNAVRYGGGGEIRVELWASEGALDVTVFDGGAGFTPRQRLSEDPAPGGMGLGILDTVSARWGSSIEPPGAVWFQLARRPAGYGEPLPEQARAGAGLLDIRRLLDSVTNHAVIALDATGRVATWSLAGERITGYTGEEVLGRPLSDLHAPASPRGFERQLADAAAGVDGPDERWLRRKDGTVFWGRVAVAPIRDDSGAVRAFSGVISDETDRRQRDDACEALIAELRELSLTDELTRLPNRRGWSEELGRELARAKRHESSLAVVMLDLNGFKAFNDERGHVAGDDLLRGVAIAWSESLRAMDMLARWGGDEFAVMLPDCAAEEALSVIGRMQDATPPGVDSAGGIATSEGSESPEALIQRADIALYDAKRQGTATVLAA